jgi:hypothetical protein
MRALMAIVALALCSGTAVAGPKCTDEAKAKWMSEDSMKAKIAQLGYSYRVFKVTAGNCYEIYGQDKAGKRVEVYFHPVTGEIVEENKS